MVGQKSGLRDEGKYFRIAWEYMNNSAIANVLIRTVFSISRPFSPNTFGRGEGTIPYRGEIIN
jgi:hypothetical protein